MTRSVDKLTIDMFEIPAPAPTTPGSLNISREIALLMSDALKRCPHDRIEVAARMTRILGKEVSLSMLNAYSAESRETHIPPLDKAIAFDMATEGHTISDYFAAKLGGRVMFGKDALLAELGRLEQAGDEIEHQKKTLRSVIQGANKNERSRPPPSRL